MIRETEEGCFVLKENDEIILSVTESEDSGKVILEIKGKLGRDCFLELEDELTAIIAGGLSVKVDLKQVTYVSPSCTNMFVRMQKIIDVGNKGNSIVFSVSPETFKIWSQQGVTDCVEIEE